MLATDEINLLLDDDGDLDLSSGDLELNYGVDAVAQDVSSALRAIRGEWFLDRSLGVPYQENDFVTGDEALLGQKYREGYARDQFSAAILGVEGVADLLSLSVSFNASTRRMTVSWKVQCGFDEVAEGTEEL
jgi:hypothetical protein